jgi:polysaccharide export outer membrane protein
MKHHYAFIAAFRAKLSIASVLPFFLLFSTLFLTESCRLRNRFEYFHDANPGYKTVVPSFSHTISIGDRLEIRIAGLEPQSSLPFSFSTGGVQQPASGDNPANNYLVNSKGEVNIPVLGSIQLAGLPMEEAESVIRNKLGDLIKSPVVSVRITNFMVSVLGEVKIPGNYKILNNRITVLDLIAMAGDVTINGDRTSVIVLRREANEIKPNEIDLTSTAIFQSPVFELRQNDIVYVKPNKSGLLQPTLFRSAAPLALSLASIGLSILILSIR